MQTGTAEVIVREIDIAASRETVFEFFVDPAKLTRWLAESAELDPRPGGVCRQVHPDKGRLWHMRGEFVELDPPAKVVFTWGFDEPEIGVRPGSSVVEVTLAEVGGGTRVRLVHRDLPQAVAGDHAAGWTELLDRLAEAVSA